MSVGLTSLLIQEEPLQVLPTLATAVGLNEGIFIQQVHFWLRHSKHEYDGRKWIFNTYEDWHKQMPWWSLPTIKRIVSRLREEGILLTTDTYNKVNIDKTLWYSIDYDALTRVLAYAAHDGSNCNSRRIKLIPSTDQVDTLDGSNCNSRRINLIPSMDQFDTTNNHRVHHRVHQKKPPENTTNHPIDADASGEAGNGWVDGVPLHTALHTEGEKTDSLTVVKRQVLLDLINDIAGAAWKNAAADTERATPQQLDLLLEWVWLKHLYVAAERLQATDVVASLQELADLEQCYKAEMKGVEDWIALFKWRAFNGQSPRLADQDKTKLQELITANVAAL